MKGLVFTELLELLEAEHGLEFVDKLLSESSLASGGAFTSVGVYPSEDMRELVKVLSRLTDTPPGELLIWFGRRLFPRLMESHADIPGRRDDAFSLLQDLDSIIHVEVLKLYPDAELPRFHVRFEDGERMELVYESTRPFADLAEGLIRGCLEYFGESVELSREEVGDMGLRGARFVLRRIGASNED
jgi:hypothetical protein